MLATIKAFHAGPKWANRLYREHVLQQSGGNDVLVGATAG
jgi:hypothetical protein